MMFVPIVETGEWADEPKVELGEQRVNQRKYDTFASVPDIHDIALNIKKNTDRFIELDVF